MLAQMLSVLAAIIFSAVAALNYPLMWIVFVLLLAVFVLSFRLIRENERVVPLFLKRIQQEVGVSLTEEEKIRAQGKKLLTGLFGTGLAFFLFPFYELRRYPMTVQQITVDVGAIVTKPGDHSVSRHDQRSLGPTELTVQAVVNFQWDVTNLEPAVKNAPPPLGEDGKPHADFVALVRPEIDHAVKSAVAVHTWYDVYYDRHRIEQDVEEILRTSDTALARSGVTESARINVVLPIVNLPETLRTAINAEQEAMFRAEATRRSAEAERDKRGLEGQGTAEARRALFGVIRGKTRDEGDQNLLAEALETLRQMAQGTASTIFVPEAVTANLGQAFGEGRARDLVQAILTGLTPEQKERLLKEGLDELRRRRQ